MLCNSEAIARVLIHAAMEQQMHVPKDLSVICQAPVSLARQYYPALTTIADDMTAVAQDSLEMLAKLVDDQPVEEPTRWIVPRLVFGQSVAAPRANR
jgi:LacI family transcriptional regulator